MSAGKSGSNTVTTQQLTPEQTAQIKAQTEFFTNTLAPTFNQIVGGWGNQYNLAAPNVNSAAVNLSKIAGQAQNAVGQTGESALNTGISGLENVFGPDYVQSQLQASLAPAQAQYQQNLTNLNTGFCGAGQIGSARQALAQNQLASTTQAQQQAAAANVLNQIAQQKAAVGQNLAALGQAGLNQAVNYAGQGVTAAATPMSFFGQSTAIPFGTPGSAYGLSPLGAGSTQSGTSTSLKVIPTL